MLFSASEPVAGETTTYWTPTRVALILWALTSAVLLFSLRDSIATLQTSNPDDALRLVQVRDLLAGQGWWDVSQHRINPAGGGGLMHWSRLIDLPLAAGIALLAPLTGTALAERIIACAWPLLLLALLFVLLARCAGRLGDRRLALLVPALAATNYVILYQFTPLRVDHHNAQVLLSLALLYLTLRPADALRGALAGLFAAMHLAISIEGLPSVALFAAILALDWVWNNRPGTGERLSAYLLALALGAITLQLATRGPDALMQRWCDALSLPYLAALVVAAIVVTATMPMLPQGGNARWWRLAFLAVAGGLSGAVLLLIEPACAAGPFAALDPVVKSYWYDHVREGLPVWKPFDAVTGFAVAPTLIGMIGSLIAWRHAADEGRRQRWLIVVAALAGTGLLSLLVLRTASTAQMMALPGCAALGLMLWDKARAKTALVPRLAGSLAAFVAVPPLAGMVAALLIGWLAPAASGQTATTGQSAFGDTCVDAPSVAALNRLPRATILAPLDIGPDLLQRTPHSVVATGHHRNNAAMALTIHAFTGSPDEALQLARQSGASLLVACPAAPEFSTFRRAAADGLASRLDRGQTPDWLEPVALPPTSRLKVWRIRR